MTTRLRSFSYDVDINPVKMTIEPEQVRTYTEDGKISVSTKVNVSDTVDVKQSAERSTESKIKPYGLDTDAGYDVEVKEKVEPAVVDEHIEQAVKKATKKKSK